MTDSTIPPLAHSIPAACARLGIGRSMLYEEMKAGAITPIRIKSKVLIPDAECVRYINERLAEARAAAGAKAA